MASAFLLHLARYGPESSFQPPSLSQARAYCSRLARSHYENFTVASLFLPRPLLKHFHAVYAYCRWADDLADEVGGGTRALGLLRWWRAELLRCYDDRPRHPVMIALTDTIHRFHIPARPFLDLLHAFEQDQLVKRYSSFDQLLRYCRYSANPVGHLVLYLCDSYDQRRALLADNICTGLQLANFWQDVDRDLEIGRVYLPREDCMAHGYPESDLQARRFTPAFARLLRFEIERTRDFFYRGMPLLDLVRGGVRADIELFANGGLAILRKIERSGYQVWQRRPALARWQKASLLTGTVVRRLQAAFSA